MSEVTEYKPILLGAELMKQIQEIKYMINKSPKAFVSIKDTMVVRKVRGIPCKIMSGTVQKMKCGVDEFDKNISALADEFQGFSDYKEDLSIESEIKVINDATGHRMAFFLYRVYIKGKTACCDCLYLYADRTITKDWESIVASSMFSVGIALFLNPAYAVSELMAIAGASGLFSHLQAKETIGEQKGQAKALMLAKLESEGVCTITGNQLKFIE